LRLLNNLTYLLTHNRQTNRRTTIGR